MAATSAPVITEENFESFRNKFIRDLQFLPSTIDTLEVCSVINNNGSIHSSVLYLLERCVSCYLYTRSLISGSDPASSHTECSAGDEPAAEPSLAECLRTRCWEELHTGHWNRVPLHWRHLYSYSCLFLAVHHLSDVLFTCTFDLLAEPLRAALLACDMALIMGAPITKTHVLTRLAELCHQQMSLVDTRYTAHTQCAAVQSAIERFGLRCSVDGGGSSGGVVGESDPLVLVQPSVETFCRQVLLRQRPAVMTGCTDHWPARKWTMSSLCAKAGYRTVPVELGRRYTDSDWSQTLMPLGQFLLRHVLNADVEQNHTRNSIIVDTNGNDNAEGASDIVTSAGFSGDNTTTNTTDSREADGYRTLAYLAQYELFDQIVCLRSDIRIPEYCYVDTSVVRSCSGTEQCCSVPGSIPDRGDGADQSSDPDVHVNVWLGPAGTVSPLHHDPKHNCLVQLIGYKRLRLFSPAMTPLLYPYFSTLLSNTSQVDVERPDLERFPRFAEARGQEVMLTPGDILYIPPGWWHFVRSETVSCSVSYWF